MATYCIACNTTPAYISYFGNCECSNPTCRFYSRDLYPPPEPVAVVDTDPTPPPKDQNMVDEEEDIGYSSLYSWSTRRDDLDD